VLGRPARTLSLNQRDPLAPDASGTLRSAGVAAGDLIWARMDDDGAQGPSTRSPGASPSSGSALGNALSASLLAGESRPHSVGTDTYLAPLETFALVVMGKYEHTLAVSGAPAAPAPAASTAPAARHHPAPPRPAPPRS